MKTIRVLCFGDVIGNVGCALFQKYAPKLKHLYNASVVIVNGENAAQNGRGITTKNIASLKHCGANLITGGNHSFQQREVYGYLQDHSDVLRPANFPSSCPGRGVGFVEFEGGKVGIINVQGRVFMHQQLDCPFKTVESLLTFVKSQTPLIIVDFHAEASSEKMGLALMFDGRLSAVVGTHTHIQTADERVLPGGTAFITDLGMAGALNSMIGMQKEGVLYQITTQMPNKFEVETKTPFVVSGVLLELEVATGKALSIERFRIIDTELFVDPVPSKEKKSQKLANHE